MRYTILLLVGFIFGQLQALSAIRLPSVIGNNLVLQQNASNKLWGWCEPGEKFAVHYSWNNQTDSVTGTRNATWQLSFKTPGAGGPYTITIGNKEEIRLENVWIGEVWICSGQSNMEMCGNWGLPDIQSELPTCSTNNIHFFRILKNTSDNPQENCEGEWKVCDSNQLKTFSAVGYFFAKKLNKELNVPVGIIESAWGGTPAEVWTPAAYVEKDSILLRSSQKQEDYDGWPNKPGYAYNAMIYPIRYYTIAGAIWYQGESNTAAPLTYSQLFTTMIKAWRQTWNKNIPFYFVQIAPFTYGENEKGALIREQQHLSAQIDNTGMVVVSDLVDNVKDIHPKDKHNVGYRLANWALAETYHQSGIIYKNPGFHSMEKKGSKLLLQFDDAPAGLIIKEGVVKELYVAGADRKFYPAQATLSKNRLLIFAPEVKDPVAVRYQFSNAGIGNIFSKEGLPLAPFRTDDWALEK